MYGSTPTSQQAAHRGLLDKIWSSWDSILLLFVIVFWIGNAASAIVQKDVISGTKIWHHYALSPCPIFITGVWNGLAGLACFIFVAILRLKDKATGVPREDSFTGFQVYLILLCGIFEGLERGLSNKSFVWLGVATRNMLAATHIIFIAVICATLGLEKMGTLKIVSVICLVLGETVQVIGLANFKMNAIGVILLSIGHFFGACRWATVQIITDKSPSKLTQLQKMELLAMSKGVDTLMCLGFGALCESGCLSSVSGQLVIMSFLQAFLVIMITFAEVSVVQRSSAVALGAVQVLSHFWSSLIPVYWNGEILSAGQWSGFAICFASALLYYAAKAELFKPAGPASIDSSVSVKESPCAC